MASESLSALVFRVQGKLCGLPLSHVIETMRALERTSLAGAPPFVLGMALVRGAPTLVVSASALLGGGEGATARGAIPSRRWIALRTSTGAAAVLEVDEVVGVRELPAAELGEVPALLCDAHAVSTIGALDRELFVVLGGAKQLSEEAAQEGRGA